MIANVTYGYTSANFSGRMPCVEVTPLHLFPIIFVISCARLTVRVPCGIRSRIP